MYSNYSVYPKIKSFVFSYFTPFNRGIIMIMNIRFTLPPNANRNLDTKSSKRLFRGRN